MIKRSNDANMWCDKYTPNRILKNPFPSPILSSSIRNPRNNAAAGKLKGEKNIRRRRWIQRRCRRRSLSTTILRSTQIAPVLRAFTRNRQCSLLRARNFRAPKLLRRSLPVYRFSSASIRSPPSISSPPAPPVGCLFLFPAIFSSPANSTPSSLARCFI